MDNSIAMKLTAAVERNTQVTEEYIKYLREGEEKRRTRDDEFYEMRKREFEMRRSEHQSYNRDRMDRIYRETDFILMAGRPWWRKLFGLKYKSIK